MAPVTRQIGLSLGADICWPLCYEGLLQQLDLALPLGDETVRFAAERVTVEPYDLQYEPKYDLVFDRVTHWFPMTRKPSKPGWYEACHSSSMSSTISKRRSSGGSHGFIK